MTKRGASLWPFTIAFCLSLSIAVFGHSFLTEIGVAGFLPELLGQGSTKLRIEQDASCNHYQPFSFNDLI
jgi:hypothetical protein